ncbi:MULTISPECIES: hypothetical protein [Rhizobium/Agrobacterium group]|uniref:Uncharacterized protein n=3 Tax=Rhizobium/Agrobacterium group TaxID=227290 RepID=A0A1B1CPI2_RHILE|nr:MULTISPECIES: hypothetical protein [Rhizobium/Agrobacterium group]ANP91674.1 hypothetical protein BA011_36970 [Rhizobium leguminosarum]API56769.1 hypothetical protein BMW22_35715 [Rhizobium leguminosarum]KAB1082433.1 hypothetical protein F4V91_32420 [Neorhizobium galegae]
MLISKLRSRILAVTFTVLVSLGAISPAHAYSVYRRVTADAMTGIVVWTAANFGVSGNPPTLSFFYYPDDGAARAAMQEAQCFVKVDLGDLINPQEGAQAAVGNADIPVNAAPADQPRPFPWMIGFDNNPPGHWSIARPQITNAVTNAAASRVAAAGFRSLATTDNSGVTVINGTLLNCRAQ